MNLEHYAKKTWAAAGDALLVGLPTRLVVLALLVLYFVAYLPAAILSTLFLWLGAVALDLMRLWRASASHWGWRILAVLALPIAVPLLVVYRLFYGLLLGLYAMGGAMVGRSVVDPWLAEPNHPGVTGRLLGLMLGVPQKMGALIRESCLVIRDTVQGLLAIVAGLLLTLGATVAAWSRDLVAKPAVTLRYGFLVLMFFVSVAGLAYAGACLQLWTLPWALPLIGSQAALLLTVAFAMAAGISVFRGFVRSKAGSFKPSRANLMLFGVSAGFMGFIMALALTFAFLVVASNPWIWFPCVVLQAALCGALVLRALMGYRGDTLQVKLPVALNLPLAVHEKVTVQAFQKLGNQEAQWALKAWHDQEGELGHPETAGGADHRQGGGQSQLGRGALEGRVLTITDDSDDNLPLDASEEEGGAARPLGSADCGEGEVGHDAKGAESYRLDGNLMEM